MISTWELLLFHNICKVYQMLAL